MDDMLEQWRSGNRKDVVEKLMKGKRSELVAFVVELMAPSSWYTDEIDTLTKMLKNRDD